MLGGQFRASVMLFGPTISGKSSIQDTLLNEMVYRERNYQSSAGILGMQTPISIPGLEGGQRMISLVEVAGSYFHPDLQTSPVRRQMERSRYVVLTYNRCIREQFEDIRKYIALIKEEEIMISQDRLFYLAGTFSDSADVVVSEKEGKQLAREYGFQYVSISSKQRETLDALFGSIVKSELTRTSEGSFKGIQQYLLKEHRNRRIQRATALQLEAMKKVYALRPMRKEVIQQVQNLSSPYTIHQRKQAFENAAKTKEAEKYDFVLTSV